MPCRRGGLVATEKGVRRLFDDELVKGLGAPKEWKVLDISEGWVYRTTSLFLWEYLSTSLTRGPHHHRTNQERQLPGSRDEEDLETWEEDPRSKTIRWKPPVLGPEGTWHQERVQNLKRAVKGLKNEQEEYQKGLEDLERH